MALRKGSGFGGKGEDSSGWSSSAWRFSSAPKMIPKAVNAENTKETKMVKRSSAPVNIPDWSKIYGKKMGSWGDHDRAHNHDDDEDDDDDDDVMVPPHEWIARKNARSKVPSFSVCEGIGRRLRGRDLSKVRNAILTKTGFLE